MSLRGDVGESGGEDGGGSVGVGGWRRVAVVSGMAGLRLG
jgi:hypothetical protein